MQRDCQFSVSQKEFSIASVGDDVIPVAEFGAVAGGVETEALADHGGDHVLHLAPTCPARGRCGGLRTPGRDPQCLAQAR